MPGAMQTLSEAVRRLLTGKTDKLAEADLPEVIVHDPAAQAPHDLDDPFFDEEVQSRIGDVIAGAGQTQKKD